MPAPDTTPPRGYHPPLREAGRAAARLQRVRTGPTTIRRHGPMSDQHQPTRTETAEYIRSAAREIAATLDGLADRIAHRGDGDGGPDEFELRQVMWEGEKVDTGALARHYRDALSDKMRDHAEEAIESMREVEERRARRSRLGLIGCQHAGCTSEMYGKGFRAPPGWRFIITADGEKVALCPEHRAHRGKRPQL